MVLNQQAAHDTREVRVDVEEDPAVGAVVLAGAQLEDRAAPAVAGAVDQAEAEVAVEPRGAGDEAERARHGRVGDGALEDLPLAVFGRLIDGEALPVEGDDLRVSAEVVEAHLPGADHAQQPAALGRALVEPVVVGLSEAGLQGARLVVEGLHLGCDFGRGAVVGGAGGADRGHRQGDGEGGDDAAGEHGVLRHGTRSDRGSAAAIHSAAVVAGPPRRDSRPPLTLRVGGRYAPAVRALTLAIAFGCALGAAPAYAQTEDGDEPLTPTVEEPDQTRLDVERLPPEAIQVTRALYAHGFFVEGTMGARGFINALGDLISVGPFAAVQLGYELFDWLHVLLGVEGSMHQTAAPPPPSRTAFELVGGTAALRLQGNFTPEFAMWLSGQVGLLIATTDILSLYGFQDAGSVGINYGGELGLDWHLRARHHSIGVSGGARLYPSLESPFASTPAIGLHGGAYLRYVF